MRQVVWTRLASKDLNKIVSFIAEDNEQNANLVGERIDATAKSLADFPIGRFGRVQNACEVVVARTPYIIAYEKTGAAIVILRVFTARGTGMRAGCLLAIKQFHHTLQCHLSPHVGS